MPARGVSVRTVARSVVRSQHKIAFADIFKHFFKTRSGANVGRGTRGKTNFLESG